MKRLRPLALALLLFATHSRADTPAPGVVAIKGGTDGTKIGNMADALKVTGSFTPSGTQNVNVTNASLAVTGTFFQATQPVSGSLGRTWSLLNTTDSVNVGNFPASFGRTWTLGFSTDKADVSGSSVSVSNFPGTQPISGTVTVSNAFALDSTLSALSAKFNSLGQKTMANSAPVVIASDQSAIPVTGPLTDTQLRASAVPVSVSNFPATQNVAVTNTPTVTANAGTGNFTVVQPTGTNLHVVTDTTSTTAVTQATAANLNATVVQSSGANLHVNVDSAPTTTVTGTVTANAGTNLNTSALALSATQTDGTQRTKVTDGTNNAAVKAASTAAIVTDPALVVAVSPNNSVAVTQATASNLNATVVQSTGTNLHTVVDSGSITANAGTNLNTSALALSANQTNGTQTTRVTDGTNTAAVKAASTAPVAADPALVVAISPNGSQATAVAQASTTSGQTGTLVQGAVTTNSPTYTTAQTDPVSLALHGGLRVIPEGGDTAQIVRNDYSSTNVTTAAYVQLVASTSVEINRLHIFDSSGQDLVLATGGAGSEVDQIQIPPGGWDQPINLYIASGTRLSVKSKSATASSGILLITGLK